MMVSYIMLMTNNDVMDDADYELYDQINNVGYNDDDTVNKTSAKIFLYLYLERQL